MADGAVGQSVRLDTAVQSYTAVAVSGTTTLTVPAGATKCVISVEDADVRYTDDGSTTPVEATDNTRRGLPVAAGRFLVSDAPTRLKIIARSGSPFLVIEWRV
jgi:hypothetical protein